MFKRLLTVSVVGLLVLAAVLATRAATLSDTPMEPLDIRVPQPDANRLAEGLAKAVRFRTVSRQEGLTPEDLEEFAGFNAFLRERFPLTHSKLQRESIGAAGALFTWVGQKPDLPAMLLLAHSDVVPAATPEQWEKPPFGGDISDGFVWGRGTLDCKNNVMAMLEAVELLLEQGVTPTRTVQIAIGHDEEIGGHDGAERIAAHLVASGRSYEFVLDEGQPVTNGMVPGVTRRVAFVGMAEKAYLTVALTAQAEGGHSSMPPARTAVGALARAVARLEANPFPARLQDPVREGFARIAPHMVFASRIVFANLWLLEPVLMAELLKSPTMGATLRTTIAPTMLSAGVKENVLPKSAQAVVNFRLLPGDTPESVMQHVTAAVGDPEITVKAMGEWTNPPPVSKTETTAYQTLARAIHTVFADAVIAPGLLSGATDSRHYKKLSPNVYRFSPVELGPGDPARFHGVDERQSVASYVDGVRFFAVLMQAP